MNTAHMIAWLTCLVLAFLACILGVFNVGRRIALERDVRRLSVTVEAMPKLDDAREELGTIGAELHSLAQTLPAEASAELRRSLAELEERVEALQQRLQ